MKRYYSPESHLPKQHFINDILLQGLRPSYSIKSTTSFTNPIRTETKKKVGRYYYYQSQQIGRGYTSCVYKAYSIDNISQHSPSQTYAIKVMPLNKATASSLELLQNQIEILKMVNHPNIIKCYDIYKSKTHCYIITEFCQGGCLMSFISKNQSLLDRKKNLNQTAIVEITKQVVEGVKYLNKTGIVHRDIKPANILKGKNAWKIADFGFAILANTQIKTKFNVGTPLYMPLQSLTQNIYSPQSDIFSIGIILYELLIGTTPWQSKSEKQLIRKMELIPLQNTAGKNKIPSQMFKLILKLCSMKKRHRMTKQEFMLMDIQSQIKKCQSAPRTQPSLNDLERQLKSIKSEIIFQRRLKPIKSMDQIMFLNEKENFLEKAKKPSTTKTILDSNDLPEYQLYRTPSLLLINQEKQKYLIESQQLKSFASKKDIYGSIKDRYFDVPSTLRPSLCLKNNRPVQTQKQLPRGSLRLDLKLHEKREDNTRCTEAKQSQNSVNPQNQDTRYSQTEIKYIEQTSHILLNQIHFCRFLFYIYKNSLYILLNKKSQQKLAVLIFQMIFATLDELTDLEVSTQRFKKKSIPKSFKEKQFRTYLKSDKYALMKKTIKEYRSKYQKELISLKIKLGASLFQQIQLEQKKHETQYMKSMESIGKQSEGRLKYLQAQLKSFLKQFDHNLMLTINSLTGSMARSTSSPRYNKNGFVAANVEGLKSLYQFYQLTGLLIDIEKDMAKFQKNSKIKVTTDYAKNNIYSTEELQMVCGRIRSL